MSINHWIAKKSNFKMLNFDQFLNKEIVIFCGPRHLYQSTSSFLIRRIQKKARKVIILADKLTISEIYKDFENLHLINCKWWDLKFLFSKLKQKDKQLLLSNSFDAIFTPVPVFPILNAVTYKAIKNNIPIFIFDQGKPNISIRSFAYELLIRNKMRVRQVNQKIGLKIFSKNIILNKAINFAIKLRLRIQANINYLDLRVNSFLNIPALLFDPFNGKYNFFLDPKFEQNILNSSKVITWNKVDNSFYKSLGFKEVITTEHPAKKYICDKESSESFTLGIYPSDLEEEDFPLSNFDLIKKYITAVRKILTKNSFSKIRIKFHPNSKYPTSQRLLYEGIANLDKSKFELEIVENEIGIIDSLKKDNIILGDFSSCLWLASNIFSKKIFIVDDIDLIQIEEMTRYDSIYRVSDIV